MDRIALLIYMATNSSCTCASISTNIINDYYNNYFGLGFDSANFLTFLTNTFSNLFSGFFCWNER